MRHVQRRGAGLPPGRGEGAGRDRPHRKLAAAGWAVQDYRTVNFGAARGVAVREFPLEAGHGRADYLLFVDRKPLGVVEAKPDGTTLTGVEWPSDKYTLTPPPRAKKRLSRSS